MGWGGRRPGAGRKRGSPKQTARVTGEETAQRILDKLGWEEQMVHLFEACGDANLKLKILIALQERAWGKPAQSVKVKKTENGNQTSFGFERLEQLLASAVRKTSETDSERGPN